MRGRPDPEKHRRRSLRLRDYDYSQAGAYFVTICTHNRTCLFGDIVDGEMRLNEDGRLAQSVWEALPKHYSHVELDAVVVMPNHVHGIIVLTATPVGAGFKPASTRHGLPEIVRAFKTFSGRRINQSRSTPGTPVWQRNYYEHVIRNDAALNRLRQYIAENPARWAEDPENPARQSHKGEKV